MALCPRSVLMLLYGWTYVCVGYCAMLKTDSFPEVDLDEGRPVEEDGERLLRDTMTEHMQMLYTKYNQAGFPFKDGNTVRSFKAHWGESPHPWTHTPTCHRVEMLLLG